MFKRILILNLILITFAFSQESFLYRESRFTLFPASKLFLANSSNVFEPKIGVGYFLEKSELAMNIGVSRDLIHYHFNPRYSFGFGTEFFSWSLLEQKSNFRFPVKAVDYMFGSYFVLNAKYKYFNISNRLRINHISAHLSDGSYDNLTDKWLANQEPSTYSREFLQWTSSIIYRQIRGYIDLTYIFHTIPEIKGKNIYGLGFEASILHLPSVRSTFFAGFDISLQKRLSNKFIADRNFSTGFFIGNPRFTHLRITYQYFNGYNFFGQFNSEKLNRSSINVSLIL